MSGTERLCRALVALASWLAPSARRAALREEWGAELWHHWHGPQADAGRLGAIWRCLGVVPHAIWLHGEEGTMNGWGRDLRFAMRALVKRPGFTAVAVVTLALGIGGNAAVFTVVDSVLLEPLPIENADRLVYTWGREFPGGGVGASVSPPDFLDYREGAEDAFEIFAAQSSFSTTRVAEIDGRPEELVARDFTADFLAALGYEPALGRTFTPAEVAGAEASVVMISHGLWGRMYGFDPEVLGRTLVLDGEPWTIVGVLPEGLDYPAGLDLWAPLTFGAEWYGSRGAHFLRPHGLLREGVTVQEAQLALDRVSARLEAAYPDTNDGWYAQLRPLQEVFVGSVRPALLVLLGGVGLVLLIACANVANLLLARAASRRGEMAVRAALGASRGRLVRQTLTESLLLAGLAGLAGIAVAQMGIAGLRALDPGNVPRLDAVAVDGTVLAFTLVLSLGVGVAFGMVPALAAGRTKLGQALGTAGRGRSEGNLRLRNALVAAEVGLSFMLLVGAGLLLRSFGALRAIDPGFETDGAVALPVSFPERRYPDLESVDAARDAVTAELAALPGVTSVGVVSILPLSGNGGDTYVHAEGRPPERAQDVSNTAQIRLVDEGYFETMGIPMAAGRAFDRSDDRGAPLRVILNETLAEDLFPDENPIGRRMVAWLDEQRPLEIVGVAADVRQLSLGQTAWREFYLPARQQEARSMQVVVRGQGGVEPVATAVRAAVQDADPGQPVSRIVPLESFIDRSLAQGRFQAVVLGLFAALALTLAAVGVYGVLAQAVAGRRREIGVRMAMGAERASVTRMVVKRALSMAALGLALGAIGAVVAVRLLGSLLFGVGPADPATWVATPIFLLGAVLLSSWLPARQAARTDPAIALRD